MILQELNTKPRCEVGASSAVYKKVKENEQVTPTIATKDISLSKFHTFVNCQGMMPSKKQMQAPKRLNSIPFFRPIILTMSMMLRFAIASPSAVE
jgi:hypothetical protein